MTVATCSVSAWKRRTTWHVAASAAWAARTFAAESPGSARCSGP